MCSITARKRYVRSPVNAFLRGDDDADQLGPASAIEEGTFCDGSGGGGDRDIRTAAAG